MSDNVKTITRAIVAQRFVEMVEKFPRLFADLDQGEMLERLRVARAIVVSESKKS